MAYAKRKRVVVGAPVGTPGMFSADLEALIRRTERILGVKRSRKINLWLSPEQHYELSRQAHEYAARDGKPPSVHRYLVAALGLKEATTEKQPRRRLRAI